MDAVLGATGDLLLAAGTDANLMVPNPGIDCSALNSRIEEYQSVLNDMEVKILAALAARNKKKEPYTEKPKAQASSFNVNPSLETSANNVNTPEMPHFDFDTFTDDFQGLAGIDSNDIFDF